MKISKKKKNLEKGKSNTLPYYAIEQKYRMNYTF